jgi:hypothetical protein
VSNFQGKKKNQGIVYLTEIDFLKIIFQTFCVYIPLKKLINRKHFSIELKFGLVFMEVFSFYFGHKIFFRSCEKIRNIILFVNYNRFGLQTFDLYIFYFEFFLKFHPLEFNII